MCTDRHGFGRQLSYGKLFTTLRVRYISRLVMWCWRQWNHIMHVTLLPCYREKHQSSSPRDVATQFAGFQCGGLQRLGYLQERVYRLRIHDVKELEECLLKEWRLLDHSIIMIATALWHSHLRACVNVNSGHFEHKFWTCD